MNVFSCLAVANLAELKCARVASIFGVRKVVSGLRELRVRVLVGGVEIDEYAVADELADAHFSVVGVLLNLGPKPWAYTYLNRGTA